jgi:hypothetical protein
MNILRVSLTIVATLVLVSGAGYLYASVGVKSKPGYAKLVKPKGTTVDTVLSLNIGPGGVRSVRWLLDMIVDESDNEHDMPMRIVRSLLEELQGVQVRIYEIDGNRRAFDVAITESVVALKKKSWESMVVINEGEDRIVAMQFGDETQISGLTVMARSADNAVFINLVGPFEPDSIARTLHELSKAR